nr:hypothetical protein [Rhodothermus marinus]
MAGEPLLKTERVRKVYDPQEIEPRWYAYWEANNFSGRKSDPTERLS